ncbi:hypothetical protein EWB00_011186, partial [Schistosoma japonicum]
NRTKYCLVFNAQFCNDECIFCVWLTNTEMQLSVDSEDGGFEMLTDVIPFLLLLSINNVIVMFFSVSTYAMYSTN